ncbi:UNVERIFIED_CONTAM: hypothetical protein GTU68_062933 [Idotea baltica]|nr:hypothetical protein [Idotea baltica]
MSEIETDKINNKYWLDRWENNDVENFCQESANEFLVKHFSKLKVDNNSLCFIPMCGSSIDILFFLSKNITVVGVEISEKAVKSFFTTNHIEYEVLDQEGCKCYKGRNVSIYVSDVFESPKIAQKLPNISIWYDRGAYIALPELLRSKYAETMKSVITRQTQVLLLVMEHDKKVQAPPFSVSQNELENNFSPDLKFKLIDDQPREDIPEYRQAEGMTFQNYKTYIR